MRKSLVLVVILLISASLACAATSTVLEPVSPTEIRPFTSTSPGAWVDDAGHAVICYAGRDRSQTAGGWQPQLAVYTGGSWHHVKLALPAGMKRYPVRLQVVGKWGDLYCFVAYYYTKQLYYYTSHNGLNWSGPKAITLNVHSMQTTPQTVAAGYVQGTPVLGFTLVTGYKQDKGVWFCYKEGASFKYVHLFTAQVSSSKLTDLRCDSRGRLYFAWMGGEYKVYVASAANLEAAKQAGNWQCLPDPAEGGARYAFSLSRNNVQVDTVRQCVWGFKTKDGELYLRKVPFGAKTEAEFKDYRLPAPEDLRARSDVLVFGNRYGALAVMRSFTYTLPSHRLDSKILCYPLGANGPEAPFELRRGGSQVEAVNFAQGFSILFGAASPRGKGVAGGHSKKRGAVPAGKERLFASFLSGWANLGGAAQGTAFDTGVSGGTELPETTGPETPPEVGGGTGGSSGGGTIPQTGGKPDLKVVLRVGGKPAEKAELNSSNRRLYLSAYITNEGADYYGDLVLKAFCAGATFKYVLKDESGHTTPLIARGGHRYAPLGRLELDYNLGGTSATPKVIYSSQGGSHTLHLPARAGKWTVSAFVDPENSVDESDESNNKYSFTLLVYDGKSPEDRLKKGEPGGPHVGLNDVAILGAKVLPNCYFARFGLLQKPAKLAFVVDNPRKARWLKDVHVQVKLDGRLLGEYTVNLPSKPTLAPVELPWNQSHQPAGKKIYCAVPLVVPVDLTRAALGGHTLEVVADPQQRLGDLVPGNNRKVVQFRVRPPGGTLRVRCLDSGSGAPIADAEVMITNLWFMKTKADGWAEVQDFPPATYGDHVLYAKKWRGPRPYALKYAKGFTVRSGQVTNVVLRLDGPVNIRGTISGESGKPPEYGVLVDFSGKHAGMSYNRNNGRFEIRLASPGTNTLTVKSYGYQDKQLRRNFVADAQGNCNVGTLQLTPLPKGTIAGKVLDYSGHPMSGVTVKVVGSPYSTVTDSSGHYEVSNLVAGRTYYVDCFKAHYVAPTRCKVVNLPANTTVTADVVLNHVTQYVKSQGAHILTWALCESYPGFELGEASSGSYKIKAYYGEFKSSLALTWHSVEGEQKVHVDDLVLGIVPGAFWGESVTFEWDPMDVVSEAWDVASDEALELLFGARGGKVVAELTKLIDPLDSVVDLLTSDAQPGQLSEEGEVTGTFTSHTGDKLEETTLFEVPSTELPVGMAFHGGETVVRVDKVVVSDGSHTLTFNRRWYSPKEGYYRINQTLDLSKLEVKVYLQVLNENRSPGPLYANSKNLLTWRPGEERWLRFEPYKYQVVP